MEIDAALAAELAVLTHALDEPDTDVADSLRRLAADVRTAVASYRGLMVVIARTNPPLVLTAFDDEVENADIRTSLMLVAGTEGQSSAPQVFLIFFAAVPGAFVDIAADLCWMTDRMVADVILDRHLNVLVERHAAESIRATTAVDQAIGLLIGCGYTPEQADSELDARAADAGTDRYLAAACILNSIPVSDADPDVDFA